MSTVNFHRPIKAFNTVNEQIFLKKPKLYGVSGNNYSCFGNYLSN